MGAFIHRSQHWLERLHGPSPVRRTGCQKGGCGLAGYPVVDGLIQIAVIPGFLAEVSIDYLNSPTDSFSYKPEIFPSFCVIKEPELTEVFVKLLQKNPKLLITPRFRQERLGEVDLTLSVYKYFDG